MNIEELKNSNVIKYVSDRDYGTQVGEALFPSVRQESLELAYIMGNGGAPVSASVHAYDTEAEIGSRDGFKAIKEHIAYIKQKYPVNEELLLRLNNLNRESPMYQQTIRNIYNDVDRSVQAVRTRIERMRYEAIATGRLVVDENKAKFIVDYGLEDDQIQDADTKWDNSADNAIDDIFNAVDQAISRGAMPRRILTSKRIVNKILQSKNIQKLITGTERMVTFAELNQFLNAQNLPVIGIEDRIYRVQNIDGTYSTHRYFPDDRLVFLPDGPVGQTVFGPTPEEQRLIQNPSVDLSKAGNIIVTIYDRNVDPVLTEIKASTSAMPSFERANEIQILKVLTPAV